MKRTQALLLAAVAIACPVGSSSAPQPGDGRTLGFATTYFYYDVYDKDPTACPDGLNKSFQDLFLGSLPKEERDKLSNADAQQRLVFGRAGMNLAGKPMCLDPDGPLNPALKPEHKVVQGRGKSYGLDLDGQVSRVGGRPAPGTCGHDDFVGLSGEKGIDNQFYRVVGCTAGFRNDSLAAQKLFATDVRAGLWNVLIEIGEVDDRQNDPDVTVSYYAARDPGPFAGGVTPVPWRSVSIVDDRRFINSGKGKIVNGQLISDPIDLRFLVAPPKPAVPDPRGFYDREMLVRGARIHAKLDANGLNGTIGGYADVAHFVENTVRMRGHFAFAQGAASVGGFSCPSLKTALLRYADGYRDPATGMCTAISTGFTVKAIPVFIIKPQTRTAAKSS